MGRIGTRKSERGKDREENNKSMIGRAEGIERERVHDGGRET